MRKVILNKWFIVTALLTISLSAFSIIAYKKVRQVCKMSEKCTQTPAQPERKGDMLIDAVSRQFTSFVSVQ
jgi:hypothetical protein